VKVGDVVRLKEDYQIKGVDYGIGIVVSTQDYPEEGFTSHKIVWSNTDFSFHSTKELELISENK
tara:strand:- start:279 stop:470 length:192 start_codon:yes stop_codon:yes gene_type:complete